MSSDNDTSLYTELIKTDNYRVLIKGEKSTEAIKNDDIELISHQNLGELEQGTLIVEKLPRPQNGNGNFYALENINEWFDRNNTDPMTRDPVTDKDKRVLSSISYAYNDRTNYRNDSDDDDDNPRQRQRQRHQQLDFENERLEHYDSLLIKIIARTTDSPLDGVHVYLYKPNINEFSNEFINLINNNGDIVRMEPDSESRHDNTISHHARFNTIGELRTFFNNGPIKMQMDNVVFGGVDSYWFELPQNINTNVSYNRQARFTNNI